MAKKKRKTDEEDYFSFADKKQPERQLTPVLPKRGQWPDSVPILTVDDIVFAYPDGPNRTHDLAGWLDAAFACRDYDSGANLCFDKAHDALVRVLEANSGERNKAVWEYCAGDLYAERYLKNYYTKKFLARCWNVTMTKLGYEVPEEKLKIPAPIEISPQRKKLMRKKLQEEKEK